jgi:GT2 family glycosyltransferase
MLQSVGTPECHGVCRRRAISFLRWYNRGPMSQPLVHILVINWNGMDHLEECYRSLCASQYENVRFVLVDNKSEDESVSFVRDTFGDDPRVSILELPENLGWSGGNNVGFEQALEQGADYAMLLNNDTAMEPGAIEAMVEMMEADAELGCVAPKMLMFDEPEILNSVGLACSVVGACWDIGLGRLDQPKWNTVQKVIGACGGAALFRCETLRKTGLLPTHFGIYLDDLDLCLRTWNAGYRIKSCPAAAFRHKFSATMGTGARLRHKYYLNTRNRGRLMLRNFPLDKLLRHSPAFVAGELRSVGRAMLDGEAWKAAIHLRSDWEGLLEFRKERAPYHAFQGQSDGEARFWPLIVEKPLFFPGTEFPERGWYAARPVKGHMVRPIARHAVMEAQGGGLRVFHANCYPDLGATEVSVTQNDREIAVLCTLDQASTVLRVEPGSVHFTAKRIFDADDSGERIDIGGWLAVEETE